MSADASAKIFFDTSVLVYMLTENDPRTAIVEKLLLIGGNLSVQTLNEFANVAHRKLKLSWDEVEQALSDIRLLCRPPVPVTVKIHDAAIQIAKRFQFSFYDSLIIAAALEQKCTTLYSEDMQNGQKIESLTIRNPFVTR
jgi:predicted nucleic acid-binding protein